MYQNAVEVKKEREEFFIINPHQFDFSQLQLWWTVPLQGKL